MGNIAVTNVDIGAVELEGGQFRPELLTFSGAHTCLAGTLLARQSDNLTVTPGAFVGTGTGTITLATIVPGDAVPKVGTWTLTCTTAVANGGVFRLDDPDGQMVRSGITMTVGAGGTTVIKTAGFQFTLTDATDFVAGDHAPLVVASGSNKLVPYATAGAGGAQRPVGLVTYDVVATGAGDIPVSMFVAGRVKKERLILDADGTGANVTPAILDSLRTIGITPVDTKQLSVLDNQ